MAWSSQGLSSHSEWHDAMVRGQRGCQRRDLGDSGFWRCVLAAVKWGKCRSTRRHGITQVMVV